MYRKWGEKIKVLIAVRSYCNGYTMTTSMLNEKLQEGYKPIMVTPFIKDGNTEYLEYILEKGDF